MQLWWSCYDLEHTFVFFFLYLFISFFSSVSVTLKSPNNFVSFHSFFLFSFRIVFSFFISNRHNYKKESSRGFSVIFLFHRDTRVNRDTNVHKIATQSTLPSFFVYLDIIHITSVTRFGDFLSYWQKNSYKRT